MCGLCESQAWHLHAQRWVEVLEAEEGRPAAGRDEAQERLLLLRREAAQHLGQHPPPGFGTPTWGVLNANGANLNPHLWQESRSWLCGPLLLRDELKARPARSSG